MIIDTKAYSKGYSLPIAQADEMERYVRENRQRREDLNPNQWWKAFEGRQDRYYFLFVSVVSREGTVSRFSVLGKAPA